MPSDGGLAPCFQPCAWKWRAEGSSGLPPFLARYVWLPVAVVIVALMIMVLTLVVMILVALLLVVITAARLRARRERHTAQHLSVLCRTKDLEGLEGGQRLGVQTISDHHELVRICALIAARADRRGNGPDGDGTVLVSPARQIAQTVGGWIGVRRRARRRGHCVGNAQIQTLLERVDQIPLLSIKHPFFQA